MLADRVRMRANQKGVTISVEYLDTPPTGYDIAFVPFVSNPPEWEPFYGTIGYGGQYVSYSDYQAYTGTPISLMTAHTTPIVVNTMELTNPMIGFKIKGMFYYKRVSVNGVIYPSSFYTVWQSLDGAYGVFFLPTNLVAGDEVILRLRRND